MNIQASRSLRFAACLVAAMAVVGLGGVVVIGSAIGALPLSAAAAAPPAKGVRTTGVRTTAVNAPAAIDRPLPAARAGRGRARCADCGVVEAVRRVDRREELAGVCRGGDRDAFPTHVVHALGDRPQETATLEDTVNGVIAGGGTAKQQVQVRVTSTYQIVVRFRDGTRHVFNEVTARNLQTGDRVQFIAGLNRSPTL